MMVLERSTARSTHWRDLYPGKWPIRYWTVGTALRQLITTGVAARKRLGTPGDQALSGDLGAHPYATRQVASGYINP
jgi:hypothetical protein